MKLKDIALISFEYTYGLLNFFNWQSLAQLFHKNL